MSLIVTKAAIGVASTRRCHVGRFGNGEFPDGVPRGRGSPLPAGPSLEAHADEGRVLGRVMPFWYVGSRVAKVVAAVRERRHGFDPTRAS